jgi:hypothetical protein
MRYHDAGSGPHDAQAREDGERNCGCEHNGRHWTSLCLAARREWQLTHDAAALEHAANRKEA